MSGEIYQVGHIERLPLGTTYPAIVAHVGRLLAKLPEKSELVIDATGVGKPVFDLFVGNGISPIGVTITGGGTETWHGRICSVPKLTLISRVQALLHEGRLKILRTLPEAETLVRELRDYRVEFTASGALTFNARQNAHDDTVLALACALWRLCGVGNGAGLADFYRAAHYAAEGLREPDRYVVGLDLGQARDPTAIAVVRCSVGHHAPPQGIAVDPEIDDEPLEDLFAR